MRLNRYLAQAGVASRRTCDALIRRGFVVVNGEVERNPARQVEIGRDEVFFKGHRVKLPTQTVVILLHKPAGYLTTVSDPFGRPTVMDLVPSDIRLFPIGRLDFDTTGALLLTNSGDLAHLLTHPRFQVPKEYEVWLRARPTPEELERIATGVELESGKIARGEVLEVTPQKNGFLVRLVLREGIKREVKRLFQALGYRVERLHRAAFAGIRVDALAVGRWRYLEDGEIAKLKEQAHGYSG